MEFLFQDASELLGQMNGIGFLDKLKAMLEQQPAKLANPSATATQEPILSSTTLASCPVAVKDFHRKFLVEAKRNCPTGSTVICTRGSAGQG